MVNEFTLDVALIICDLHGTESFLKNFQMALKALFAVQLRLALS
jgi:hypothetical protein